MSHLHSPNKRNDENTPIVVTCPQGFVGVSSVFRHGEKEGLWKFKPMNKIFESKHDLLILGAWYPGYEILIDLCPKELKKVIWITSSVAQMEMTPVEIQQCGVIANLLHNKNINAIFYSGKGANYSFQDESKVLHALYPLNTQNMLCSHTRYAIKKVKSIGLFMPAHYRKNISNQSIAFYSLIKESYHIHTNINLGFTAKQTPVSTYYDWLNHKAYLDILSEMMVSLHCTWTESFSYGAAESIIAGTIPIISPTIAENLEIKESRDKIMVQNIDNPHNIADKVREISSLSQTAYLELLSSLQNDLTKYSQKAKYHLEETLDRVKSI